MALFEGAMRSIAKAPARLVGVGRRRRRRRWRRRLIILILFVVLFPVVVLGQHDRSGSTTGPGANFTSLEPGTLEEVSRRTGIPTCAPQPTPDCVPALEAYISAAARPWRVPGGGTHNVDWSLLAAIGRKECDHGRLTNPRGCHAPDKNSCGARGPMQFLGNTWRNGTDPPTPRGDNCPGVGHFTGDPVGPPIPEGESGGYATDGDNCPEWATGCGDGTADPWNMFDAAHAAARYLIRNGVKDDPHRAVFAYNHSDSYVSGVLGQASEYKDAVANLVINPLADGTGGPATGDITDVPCPEAPPGKIYVDSSIAANLRSLLGAAGRVGLVLCGGGFRTREQQIERRIANGCPDVFTAQPEQCRTPTAIPGTSMHERGLAVDFTCRGALVSGGDPCFQWLVANAHRYGLKNLPSEPWHWSTNGG
jgi:hypothetical protein